MLIKSLALLMGSLALSLGSMTASAVEAPKSSNGQEYILVLEGDRGFNRSCTLSVLEEGYDLDGSYYAVVETNFRHGRSGPGILRTAFTSSGNTILVGSNEDGAQISIQLLDGGQTVADAVQYAVRWRHHDHYDTGRCADLLVSYDQAEHGGHSVL